MKTFIEGNLQISFPRDTKARKFDDGSHGLPHCMKAADFIASQSDCILFIEFKDPDIPKANEARREDFVRRFHSGKLNEDLKYKSVIHFYTNLRPAVLENRFIFWCLSQLNLFWSPN